MLCIVKYLKHLIHLHQKWNQLEQLNYQQLHYLFNENIAVLNSRLI